ncbi:MAG: pantetheine-phosphate adenylyltransferase [Lachnospiraceae bacterium]|nr:pantetheine-phosphate adenylyltransferase [Lachnospiraceae bacterium]
MERIAVYPGSFDPVTLGHLDIIERSAKIFDKIIVGVLNNNSKIPLFSAEERVSMLVEVTKHLENVQVMAFEGLLVDFASQLHASVIIRGLRAVTDFEYELQMAQTNRIMQGNIDTFFLTTSLEYSYLSSSVVREVAKFGGDVAKFVPASVIPVLYKKVRRKEDGIK